MRINFFIYIVCIFIFVNCASVTSPTGGPRDEDAPILISASPSDQTVQFDSREIILEFNEFVQVEDLKEQLLVTPRLTEDIEAIAKKTSVILRFNEDLQPNTTYNLNFRDAIVDVTEKNPVLNLKYAFSTGPYIDSAYVTGNVYNILVQKPIKNGVVGIYQAGDTLDIINQPPDYMTITDDEGNFRIDNLKSGDYRIYALVDGNKNSMLDMKSESYGFLADTIHLDTSLTELKIPVIRNDLRPLEITSARTSGKYFVAKTNKYLKDVQIKRPINDSVGFKIEQDHLSFKFYNTLEGDSLELITELYDSLENITTDTIMLKFVESPRAYDKYSAEVETKPVISTRKILEATIRFDKPTRLLEIDSLYLQVDTLLYIPLGDSILTWNKRGTEASFVYDLNPWINDSTNTGAINVMAAQNSFISIESDSLEETRGRVQYVPVEKSGNIEVEVIGEEAFIIQLLSTDFKVIREVANEKKFSFNHLPPGTYQLRALVDSNKNGKYDPGNLYLRQEPEPVVMYRNSDGSTTLTLKANWVLGPNEIHLNPVDN